MDIDPVVLSTPPTKYLTKLLAEDTLEIAERGKVPPFDPMDMMKLQKHIKELDYLDDYTTDDYSITLFDAGHIPGSALTYVEFGDDTLLYTGDIKNSDTRLLRGSKIHYPDAKTLMIESTYFGKNHQDRKMLEQAVHRVYPLYARHRRERGDTMLCHRQDAGNIADPERIQHTAASWTAWALK